jgi:ferritin
MISKKMQTAFNEQVAAEFYSSHLYLAMSAYLQEIDLPGFANWMRIQYKEETAHAEKFFDYVIERDGRAELLNWEAPPKQWKSGLAVFEEAYKHEQKVTSLINKLMDIAVKESDYASQSFLKWFIDEQVEEEASVKAIVQQLKLIDVSKSGLFQLDRELGQRTLTPPAAEAD